MQKAPERLRFCRISQILGLGPEFIDKALGFVKHSGKVIKIFDSSNTLRVGKAVADTEPLSLGVPLSVLVAAGERETLAERDPEKEADDE